MGRSQELLDAAREGDKRTVEKIIGQITKRSGPFTSLRRGAGVNVQDDSGYTPLHHACLRGHKEIVHLLLSVDASPCIVDKMGATPLHLAAWKGDSNIVAMLLAHNNPPVNIDHLTLKQETALLIAAQSGYVEVVAQLLAKGADVNVKNMKHETSLDLAAQYGRTETVKHLIRARPQLLEPYKLPKCKGREFPSTPLHRASKSGHREIVTALIEAGVDPNVRTTTGATPLHEAACYGKAIVVQILLEKGANLNAVDRRGKTVHDLLADYSEEATRRVKKVIQEYESMSRSTYESEDDLPPFPVQDSSPTSYPIGAGKKAPETPKSTNSSLLSPSSSSLTKSHSQSFVKKLASKYLGLKSKFNSAPNISNNSGLESEVGAKSKQLEQKNSTNTLLIGNSKFFKILSKKEDSGEIVCTDEFDTVSLDGLVALNNRDSVVNRSNRSCPGFKTSLPNISENTELSDSRESITDSVVITELDCDNTKSNKNEITEAINHGLIHKVFAPKTMDGKRSLKLTNFEDSANLINECYESYEFSKFESEQKSHINSIPKPPPRSVIVQPVSHNQNVIYENVIIENKTTRPTPATRTHVSLKPYIDEEKEVIYENFPLMQQRKQFEPPIRSFLTQQSSLSSVDKNSSPSASRSSTLSSDSMIDESNLEDILLSEKSRSFRHGKKLTLYTGTNKSDVHRTQSNASDSSGITEASALENVDCSDEVNNKSIYLSMTGTLPNKKSENSVKKKVLFRHKTFTNIEVDRLSTNVKDLPKWGNDFLKETLSQYHIRGTGHCIYKAPTVQEFIYIFNRETLYKDIPPFIKVPDNRRDSYFETAICFCKPKPPKHHNSAGDLLDISSHDELEKVTIDTSALKRRNEIISTSFRCFCDSGTCNLHDKRRESLFQNIFVVKFSAFKKSISTPDITLDSSPSSTIRKGLTKNKSVPSDLEEPYAVVTIDDIVTKNRLNDIDQNTCVDPGSPIYTTMMSQPSTLSSISSTCLYSVKDIAEVISINENSTATDTNPSCASDRTHVSLRKSSSSEHSGHWSLQSCNSNVTIKSDLSFKTCFEESSEDESDDGTLHSDGESSDAETIKSDASSIKRPWIHSDSFRFGNKKNSEIENDVIVEEDATSLRFESSSSKFESGISVGGSESWSSGCEGDSVPRADASESLGVASLERGAGVPGGVRSGSGRRRWDEADGTSEGDALSVSSAASSCAPHHLAHHHEYSKVSPTPPKKPPRRNLSVSPTHANSPSSGYSYELRTHARSQDDLDDIQGAKHYLKHGRSVDQYVDGKLSYSEYEENHNSPRVIPTPNPRPSLKHRSQPVAITAMYQNVVIKEQNPRRKLRRNNFAPQYENFEPRMNETRVRKYSNQEKSSLESLLDDQSLNSPSDCERYYDGQMVKVPLSPSHYEQPPTPEHPPPSARQAENSIHEKIRPLSQLIMEVVEEIRIRKKSQADITEKS